MGSPRFHTVDAGAFSVTDAWFPPNEVLPLHSHDRPIFGVMLDGAFETCIAGRALDCPHASAWVEPASERHMNRIGVAGARVLVIQPDVGAATFTPFATFLSRVAHLRSAELATYAMRLRRELRERDDVAPLAISALAVAMLSSAARAERKDAARFGDPPWLDRVRELLHDRFRERLELGELARVADVHPSSLARAFRARYGVTIGEYIRRLRVDWALDRLARSDLALSEIAATAGFADQSHFAREVKRRLGVTPLRYRRECQSRD